MYLGLIRSEDQKTVIWDIFVEQIYWGQSKENFLK